MWSKKSMNILQELKDIINEFYQDNKEGFAIDTLRTEFQKQYKKERLDEIGIWKKIRVNDKRIMSKLKKRLTADEVTSAYQLQGQNIYYFNSSTPPKYRKATMVIFGMKQYHKEAPKLELITKILTVLNNVSNIDVCFDMKQRPNIEALTKHFQLKQFITPTGIHTDTYYINNPQIAMIEKITIYNKATKNSLKGILHRIEAKILIPNIKTLAIPLHDLKEIIDIARGN